MIPFVQPRQRIQTVENGFVLFRNRIGRVPDEMRTIGNGNQTDRSREKRRSRSVRQILGTPQFETKDQVHRETDQRNRLHKPGDQRRCY